MYIRSEVFRSRSLCYWRALLSRERFWTLHCHSSEQRRLQWGTDGDRISRVGFMRNSGTPPSRACSHSFSEFPSTLWSHGTGHGNDRRVSGLQSETLLTFSKSLQDNPS